MEKMKDNRNRPNYLRNHEVIIKGNIQIQKTEF
jgi:hypothetical protein